MNVPQRVDMESLVRPFQTNQITPSQTYYPSGQVGVENIVLRIGRGGQGKVMNGSYNFNYALYCDKHENEKAK